MTAIKKIDAKTERSIRQRVGRAIARFRRDTGHHDIKHTIVIFDDGTFSATITCAGGDNVSWATRPMWWVIDSLKPIAKTSGQHIHSCGFVSRTFRLIQP